MDISSLVCFAVKEEAAPFRKRFPPASALQVLITGMGRRNSERALSKTLEQFVPKRVLTCGFAGGLNPALVPGTVLFQSRNDSILAESLKEKGLRPARFLTTEKVATTAAEKRALFEQTGFDAVEMESGVIQNMCEVKRIPCATIRVILDGADEDLPLDFNTLMNEKQEMDYWRLAATLVRSPHKIRDLIKLQKQSKVAAEKLAEALCQVV